MSDIIFNYNTIIYTIQTSTSVNNIKLINIYYIHLIKLFYQTKKQTHSHYVVN
jgi:hypothetical protein